MLIDAACEIDWYASDITRTFPVSGTFSPEQKAIYELVLASQEAAFKEIGPGKHWKKNAWRPLGTSKSGGPSIKV